MAHLNFISYQLRHCMASNIARQRRNYSVILIFFLLIIVFSFFMLIVIQVHLLSNNKAHANKFLEGPFVSLNILNDGSSSLQYYTLSSNVSLVHHSLTDSASQLTFSKPIEQNDFWQPVLTSSNKFFVFSAYLDRYSRSNLNKLLYYDPAVDDLDYFVRIIAVTQLSNSEKIVCCFASSVANDSKCHFRKGKSKPIREHWNLKFSAFFLYCPLPKYLNASHVSVLAFKARSDAHKYPLKLLEWANQSNRVQIHTYHASHGTIGNSSKMAVCVKPLHYNYNKTINFIEFIELNRLLGVEHFYFYNHTTGFEVSQVLRHYIADSRPFITVLPWSLPVSSQTEIRTEGIFAALNDCLYRAKWNRFDLVMFIDLDEFIIPQHHDSLLSLVRDNKSVYKHKIGAYSFRNGFFYLQYPDNRLDFIKPAQQHNLANQLVTLTKTNRKPDLNIHRQRSKCIVITEHTVEMGNHFVWEYSHGKHTLNIDPSIAYLHHYRTCEFGGDQCIYKHKPVIDRRAHNWTWKLLSQVQSLIVTFCAEQKQTMPICQLAP